MRRKPNKKKVIAPLSRSLLLTAELSGATGLASCALVPIAVPKNTQERTSADDTSRLTEGYLHRQKHWD